MDSIGLLYSLKDNNVPQSVVTSEVHVNYWKLPNGSGYSRFLDLGIMINERALDIKSIFIYLPFKVDKDDLHDLGGNIKDGDFLCTLFNCDCKTTNKPKQLYSVSFPNNSDRHPFWLCVLNKDSFSIEKLLDGTLIEIKININKKEDCQYINKKGELVKRNLYVRFRIGNIEKKHFSTEENLSNDFLQAAFSRVEMVDFHINEYRSMNGGLYSTLEQNDRHFFKFNKVHFYFVGSTETDNIDGTTPVDQRLHQVENWKNYLTGVNYDKNKSHIAYHWSKKAIPGANFGKYNLFFKVIYRSKNTILIIKYILFAIAMNVIGGLLATLLGSRCS